jgi:hypothetical protein
VLFAPKENKNLIEKQNMVGLRTSILLRRMRRYSHLYYYPLGKVYKDQLKSKGESEDEEKDQLCEEIMKSENKVSQERRSLDLFKI